MTTKELIDQIRIVADICDESDEQQAVKSILYGLLGAMMDKQQLRLMAHIAEFSRGEVRRLSANRN